MTDATKTFADLGVDSSICEALADAGITHPFPIQHLTLPLALTRADVIGQARTGTGKTLAFGIPLLQAVDTARTTTQALVIVPTRELCLQVHDDLRSAGARRGITTAAVYGGKAIEAQTSALAKGVQVVVGTPGRLLDLRRRGTLDLSGVNTLVLDEADEMLDMGFLPDVEQLVQACSTERQTLLFSATMPSEVVGLARRYMDKPTFMRADVEEPQIGPDTRQVFLACHRLDKPAVLARILRTPKRGLCVVFTRTKRMADVLVEELAGHGVQASAIHSNLRQEMRERTLERFRKGKVDVLCATEVAARGLDISDVTHVVNYDCPDDEKMYLHRIGRTGRAGAGGVAVTMTLWNEQARLEMIKKALGIEEPTHEVFSTSPELDELFDLPATPARALAEAEAEVEAVQPALAGTGTAVGEDRPKTASSRRRNRTRERTRARDDEHRTARTRPGDDTDSNAADTTADTTADVRTETPSEGAGREQVRERRRVRPRTARHGAEPRGRAGATAPPETAEKPEKPVHREVPEASGGDVEPTAEPTAEAEAVEAREETTTTTPKKSRSRRGRRGGRGGTTDNGQEKPAPAEHEESTDQPRPALVARGGGQPALTRPMTISHLP